MVYPAVSPAVTARPPTRAVQLEAIDDDELPAPRPLRRRPESDYMPCPKCGNPDPERVHFTFWGSFHVTNMVSHVQCPACGTCYNGRTGRSNLPVAVLCITIPLLLIFAVIGTLVWWIMVGSKP
jgi:hypothetical protein